MYNYTWGDREVMEIIDNLYSLDIITDAQDSFDPYIERMIWNHGGTNYEQFRKYASDAYQRRQEEESRKYSLSVL